ncbi:Parp12 [Symbiodinium natans]|uniref:Poly [ADP-ribose] polymerase n=1 Tax=Symbiodinium natans TaxID=878477 RepID=A0A812UP36_9DINO|nr:Parp12 [Symbiodinium natans]
MGCANSKPLPLKCTRQTCHKEGQSRFDGYCCHGCRQGWGCGPLCTSNVSTKCWRPECQKVKDDAIGYCCMGCKQGTGCDSRCKNRPAFKTPGAPSRPEPKKAPEPKPEPELSRGIKLLEFQVRGRAPGREFAAQISCQDLKGAIVAAQVVQRQELPSTWVQFSVYLASVVFVYHEDEAEESNAPNAVAAGGGIHLDLKNGVSLLGENILPSAIMTGEEGKGSNMSNQKHLREEGRMSSPGAYEMRPSLSFGTAGSPLLQFSVHSSTSGRQFSAYLVLEDGQGQTLSKVVLLDRISLSSKPEAFCFHASRVAFATHNTAKSGEVIYIDTVKGVSFLGENILPTCALVGHNWPSDNGRWSWMREKGWMCWEGQYEMRASPFLDDMSSLAVEMPAYWKAEDGQVSSRRIQETAGTCKAIQSLMDSTWKATVTRDRAKEDEEGHGRSVKQFEVVQVLRNENPSLWAAYWRQRERIRKQCEGKRLPAETAKTSLCDAFSQTAGCLSLAEEVREFYLFHGTRPSAANQICSSDFRVDMAGSQTGTLYGKGLYFAEASSKADEYASDDKEGLYTGLFCMLLCRVTCGDWIYTDEAKPDVGALVQDIRQGHHDSVLGDREKARGTYREFIVFNSDQVYPEYIIIYKRKEAEEISAV